MSDTDAPPTLRVLYLEDQPWMAETLTAALQRHGMQVTWCETFDGAVRAASNLDTDVCVADHDLGLGQSRTGLEFLADYDGRKILFSGDPPDDVPDDVEVIFKHHPQQLLDVLQATRPVRGG